MLDSKSGSYDRLAEELASEHQKINEHRREVSTLQQARDDAVSEAATSRMRLSNLQQELDLIKQSNEWFDAELKNRVAETSKLRKEKNAKIAELQRQNEDSTAAVGSLKRTEAALRNRIDELEQKTEQSFARIQQLEEQAARDHEASQKELKDSQRLAELLEKSGKTTRERLQEVHAALEQTKEDAAEEVGRVRAEAETERTDKEAAERRISELEVVLERLEADLATASRPESRAGTPHRRMNGSLTPTRDSMSSLATPRGKSSLSLTQMYSDYSVVKSQLEAEKRRNERLSATIDEMIQDLESKQPEMEDLRSEHERLESEVVEVTSLLDSTGKERDGARKEARKLTGQLQAAKQEGNLLRQQLRDLSLQVRVLLTEIQARDEGQDSLDPASQARVLELARRDDIDSDDMTDTGRLISQRLTTFRSVQQLQEQNVNLLRAVRELGDKMEGEEALKRQSQHAKDLAELEELRTRMEQCEDELRSMAARSESYLKERDMFRRMLQYRGQLPANTDLTSMFNQSINDGASTASADMRGTEQLPNAQDASDMRRLIKEMQSHFDAYREEAAADHRALKEQAEKLSREKGDLQVQMATTRSQLSLARERFEMLQANYHLLQTENGELQKRSNALSESAAKQDLRTQQVAEDLVESKAAVESMRNEMANLRAEKDLWKRIEDRLSADNEGLRKEKQRLNSFLQDMQRLQNERELSDSETRRKLQAQLENHELELQATKRKLTEEIEDSKKTALRRELESQQHQKQIDDLRTALGNGRENLASAEARRDHLQARVDELNVELKAAEDRSRALQPRPVAGEGRPADSSADRTDEASANAEQDQSAEVAELKRALEAASSELENSKAQIDQYKAISQASEEQLQSVNDSYELYRQDVDQQIAEKDGKIQDLERRLEEISTELASNGAELSRLRTEQAEATRLVQDEKTILESENSRLKDENDRYLTTARFHQEDLKAQAEIAQQAQRNYENELFKHAEAAKSLQDLRKEYTELRTDVVQLRTEAESARATLNHNEDSWEETKQRYEQELRELKSRRDEVTAQNDILHKRLEALGGEIAGLREQRANALGGGGSPTALDAIADRSAGELRDVIAFLRRDKEIVDVQYELCLQESKRLKQQLDYAQSQLDECRLKLDQERRTQAESGKTLITHNELLEKINELNLYRESTVTLRNEARQAQAQLAEKTKQVEDLIAEIQPLNCTIQELQISKESQEDEIKLLQEDRERWQQRTQNILQKYDRVDPAELDGLKEQISALQSERDQLKTETEALEPLREQVESIPEQIQKAQEEAITPWRERQEKQVVQFKERSRVLVAAKNDKIVESQNLAREKDVLEQQLAGAKQDAEQAKAERDEAVARAASLSARKKDSATSSRRSSTDAGQVPEVDFVRVKEERDRLEERATSAEAHAKEQEDRLAGLQAELASCQSRIVELEQQVVRHAAKERNKRYADRDLDPVAAVARASNC